MVAAPGAGVRWFAVLSFGFAGLVTSGSAGADPDPAQPAWPDRAWSPVDDDGWPRGQTLGTLRGLHECATGELVVVEGGSIPCRPAALVGPAHLAFGLDWTNGLAFGSARTAGGIQALGIETAFAVTRRFQLAARYQLIGTSTPVTVTLPHAGLGHELFAIAKRRFFVDETARTAVTLGAGLGWALRGNQLGGSAPVARLSLARDIGMFIDDNNAITASLELAYERSLGDEPLQAVIGAVRIGFELDIREPENVGTPASPPAFRYTVSGDGWIGAGLGLGWSLELPVISRLSLQSTAGFLFGLGKGEAERENQGFRGASWSAMTGPRLALPGPSIFDFYAQAQAGPVWLAGDTTHDVRIMGQGEAGVRLDVGCGTAVDVGVWVRADVEHGLDPNAGGLMFRVAHINRSGRSGSCGGEEPTFATEPPPPPPPPPEPPEPTRIAVEPPRVEHVEAGATVAVAVEVRPIVIDVVLGAAIPGFAIRLDPRLLPLDRLRGAGYVTVELSGPAGALGTFQAQLGGTLGRAGAQVQGWATVPTTDRFIRARFTIWPPGTRP
jgi:hypothetical protein